MRSNWKFSSWGEEIELKYGKSLKGYKDGIQRKYVRGKKLKEREKRRNILISKVMYKVERIFGGIKKWFKSGICRYVGKVKRMASTY